MAGNMVDNADGFNKQSVLKEFGSLVRKKRLETGVSQEKLAFESGLHRTYIGSIERGERNITIVNIFRIAKALKCSAKEIIPREMDV